MSLPAFELPQRYLNEGSISFLLSLFFFFPSLSRPFSSSRYTLELDLSSLYSFTYSFHDNRHNVSLHGLLVYLRPPRPHRYHLPLQTNPNRPRQNKHQNRLRRRRLLSLQATSVTRRRIPPHKPDLGSEVGICLPARVERWPFSRGGD